MQNSPKALRVLGATVLGAAVVMFGALFMPFVRQGCIFCPISLAGIPFALPSFSLMQGLDGWIVMLVVVALAFEASAYVVNIRQRAAAMFSLGLSAVALGLGVFEGVDSAGRVAGLDRDAQAVELGGGNAAVHALTPPAYWVVGFYVFVSAAVVAILTSCVLVAATRRRRTAPERPVATAPAAYGH